MIVGIGSDIIDINRVNNVINRFGKKFINRCFNQIEIDRSSKRLKSSASFAKRFAAKEACLKALGTGLSQGIFWKDVCIKNDKYGKPSIELKNNALKKLKKIVPKDKKPQINLTITDEKNFAYAMVVISF